MRDSMANTNIEEWLSADEMRSEYEKVSKESEERAVLANRYVKLDDGEILSTKEMTGRYRRVNPNKFGNDVFEFEMKATTESGKCKILSLSAKNPIVQTLIGALLEKKEIEIIRTGSTQSDTRYSEVRQKK